MNDDDGDVTRRELEELVLGGPRLYTRAEVAARSDVPVELADRMWRALGFADVADDDRSFTDNDVQALREAVALVEAGVVDQVTLLAMTRAMGQTLSRLAEWQVESVAELILRQGIEVSERDLFETARFLLPVLERLTRHVWRRHLVAVTGRALATTPEELTARSLGVGFADLVGFTSLSRRLTETELAGLVESFESQAADIVAAHHGRVVKTVGDEILFVAERPVDVAEIGLALAEIIGDEADLPPVRVGLACGTVLTRLGDVYGTPVNLASRLTSLARPGTVLVDRDLASELDGVDGFELRRLRRRSVRGFEHLETSLLRRAGSDG
ncbi:MAG TPA: adenylate/guanylate cyclase domain-containing protein [Mycobacteriales bacterium]|nr:adenylate/guanylate cyclase domain-containing protein [Mycobacteriales bacterium]